MALDKISITAYNSGEISDYAAKKYKVGRYDEVETEYYVRKARKVNIFDSREKELWEKVKPYLVGDHLKDDAPEDVTKAEEELHKLAWENLLDSMQ